MKILWHNWLWRSLFIITISILLSLLLSMMAEYQITVEGVNKLAKVAESMTKSSEKSLSLIILPWVKEAVFIGLPMLLLIVIRRKKQEK